MAASDYRLDRIRILLKPSAIGPSDHEVAIALRSLDYLSGGYLSQESSTPTLLDIGDLKITEPGRAYLASLVAAVYRESTVGKMRAGLHFLLGMVVGTLVSSVLQELARRLFSSL